MVISSEVQSIDLNVNEGAMAVWERIWLGHEEYDDFIDNYVFPKDSNNFEGKLKSSLFFVFKYGVELGYYEYIRQTQNYVHRHTHLLPKYPLRTPHITKTYFWFCLVGEYINDNIKTLPSNLIYEYYKEDTINSENSLKAFIAPDIQEYPRNTNKKLNIIIDGPYTTQQVINFTDKHKYCDTVSHFEGGDKYRDNYNHYIDPNKYSITEYQQGYENIEIFDNKKFIEAIA
jgi:hypothetical protein